MSFPSSRPLIVTSHQENVPPAQTQGFGPDASCGSFRSAAQALAGAGTSPPAGVQLRWKTARPTDGLSASIVRLVPGTVRLLPQPANNTAATEAARARRNTPLTIRRGRLQRHGFPISARRPSSIGIGDPLLARGVGCDASPRSEDGYETGSGIRSVLGRLRGGDRGLRPRRNVVRALPRWYDIRASNRLGNVDWRWPNRATGRWVREYESDGGRIAGSRRGSVCPRERHTAAAESLHSRSGWNCRDRARRLDLLGRITPVGRTSIHHPNAKPQGGAATLFLPAP